jgi:flagellar biosynthesis chaperone FliJ
MNSHEKKIYRLNPIIEERQEVFNLESEKLNQIRRKKIETTHSMKHKQSEYMEGVSRLNNERSTSNRLMLEALETGLDTVKSQWMKLYQTVLELDREEKNQLTIMSQAHKNLEAIKSLQNKYKVEFTKELSKREQKDLDEHSLKKFLRQS